MTELTTSLSSLSDDQLFQRFERCFVSSLQNFYEACRCLVELQRRGVTITRLGDIEPGFRCLMEKIGSGQFLEALYEKFRGKPQSWLNRIANYSLAEQERLLADGLVTRLVIQEGGNPDLLSVPLDSVDHHTYRQVFARNRLRTTSEQRQWLIEQNAKTATAPINDPVRIDRPGGAIIVAGIRITKKQLRAYLESLEAPHA